MAEYLLCVSGARVQMLDNQSDTMLQMAYHSDEFSPIVMYEKIYVLSKFI